MMYTHCRPLDVSTTEQVDPSPVVVAFFLLHHDLDSIHLCDGSSRVHLMLRSQTVQILDCLVPLASREEIARRL